MNAALHQPLRTELSRGARERITLHDHGALFYADWLETVFIHLEVDPEALQAVVPFPLDLRDGRAYVSLVAFTLGHLRPRGLGPVGRFIMRPASDHRFLNLRTYVRQGSETGIYFLAEWLNNRLVIPLGPPMYGLPYRYGQLEYHHTFDHGSVRGTVTTPDESQGLVYGGMSEEVAGFDEVEPATLEEFLIERYTAFTHFNGKSRFFRIWHAPWPQCRLGLELDRTDLLTANWLFFHEAKYVSAHYSPGLRDVWMGIPHTIPPKEKHHRLNTFFQFP